MVVDDGATCLGGGSRLAEEGAPDDARADQSIPLQEDQEKMRIMKEQEERLITTSFHDMVSDNQFSNNFL